MRSLVGKEICGVGGIHRLMLCEMTRDGEKKYIGTLVHYRELREGRGGKFGKGVRKMGEQKTTEEQTMNKQREDRQRRRRNDINFHGEVDCQAKVTLSKVRGREGIL